MITSIKRPSGGNAGWFDKVWRRLKELRVIPGRGLVSTQTPEGMILSVKETARPGGSGGGAILRAAITSGVNDLNDYLLCEVEGEGSALKVAKPPLLRVSTFDGLTVNGVTYDYSDTNGQLRKAYSDNVSTGYYEWQQITPSWVAGEIIYVTKQPDGGTGVTGADFIDINADGRCWAEVYVDE